MREYRWTMNNMLAGDTEPGHFPEDVEPEDPRDEEEAAFDRACETAPKPYSDEEVGF